ncbi:hypothetical protein [Anaeromyxobacter oryzae]|uniref:Scaffolding protein n=1 Tax=Anaeromyxobacter oryzae TaxID=2918170 RepID=A0ABN6MZF0_9BACT|nr:hypothetical protein [Anaeromyxobacter oryzae]BDG04948.1 hypothetical protein AMOR_39440 [Anaeromyxobacter oryzae]
MDDNTPTAPPVAPEATESPGTGGVEFARRVLGPPGSAVGPREPEGSASSDSGADSASTPGAARTARERIDEAKRARDLERREREVERWQKRFMTEEQQVAHQTADFRQDVRETIAADRDRWELVNSLGLVDRVIQYHHDVWAKYGQLIDPAEIADKIEEAALTNLVFAAKTKKLKAALAPPPPPRLERREVPPGTTETRRLDDTERMARAREAIDRALGRLK